MDANGLKKVVQKYGGEAFVDEAVNFVSRAPKVKAMFNKFGVNPQSLKNNVMKELSKVDSMSNTPKQAPSKSQQSDSVKQLNERLKNLK